MKITNVQCPSMTVKECRHHAAFPYITDDLCIHNPVGGPSSKWIWLCGKQKDSIVKETEPVPPSNSRYDYSYTTDVLLIASRCSNGVCHAFILDRVNASSSRQCNRIKLEAIGFGVSSSTHGDGRKSDLGHREKLTMEKMATAIRKGMWWYNLQL